MRFAFGEDEVKRIAKAVKIIEQEQGSSGLSSSSPRHIGSHLSIVKVTNYGSPFYSGKRIDFNSETASFVEHDDVKIREVSGRTLALNTYLLGFFVGYYNQYPAFLVAASSSSGQSLDVVVDVLCDPVSGIQVEKAKIGTLTDTLVYRSFTSLIDCPNSFAGHGGQVLRVNSASNGLEFVTVSGATGGAVVFPDLSDVPKSYNGAGLFAVGVKSTQNGLEFVAPNVGTKYSVSGGGNLFNRSGKKFGNYEAYSEISLVNDLEEPGYNMVYGTDSKGQRGWINVGASVKTITITTDAGVMEVTGSPASGNNPSIKITLFDHEIKNGEYGGLNNFNKPVVPILSVNKYGVIYDIKNGDLQAIQKLTLKSINTLEVTDGIVEPTSLNDYEGNISIELIDRGVTDNVYGDSDQAGKAVVPVLSVNKYGIVYDIKNADLQAIQKLTLESTTSLDVTNGEVVPSSANNFEGLVTIEIKQQGTINLLTEQANYVDGTSLESLTTSTDLEISNLYSKLNQVIQMLKDMGASG